MAVAPYPININSGNPRYPFPQFLSYGPGRDNLANVNPQGVPHAEMEQRVRDAWQIMANNFIPTGQVFGGIPYVTFWSAGEPDFPTGVSEGDGYAMLAAAYMADKRLFDGMWMWVHDNRMNNITSRYSDCGICNGAPLYGRLPGWRNVNCGGTGNANSATDGDVDIALGLLMAWYQWGDDSGVPICGGGTMNYRTAAMEVIRGLVELSEGSNTGDQYYTSGDIGFDGYVKNGNTWLQTSDWTGTPMPGFLPEKIGPQTTTYFDYFAPGYFTAFAQFLQAQGDPAWNYNQFRRAAASTDWLMGRLIALGPTYIPISGRVEVNGVTPTFGYTGQTSEDFRLGMRTVLNYVWNGNPTTSWDPAAHQVVAGGNTYELQAGQRMTQFLSNPQGGPWNNPCRPYSSSSALPLSFSGPSTVDWATNITGVSNNSFNLNWIIGASGPSAVAGQDFALMAELFRQCVIEWDVDGDVGQNYLTSKPRYFHEFFRWYGMNVLSGNLLNPAGLVAPGTGTPPSNLKVYKSVDRTYAFPGDTLTYWLNYRNYASTTAVGVVLMDTLPAELGYVSANPAPASAPAAGANGVVRWNLPNVPGFSTGGLGATQGGVTLVARVLASSGRFCNTASIGTSNGTGWTSNEYPNEISSVMKRNCVDIVPEVMSLTKTAAPAAACVGDRVTFTLNYRDNPGAWINGGRTGVVVAYANDGLSAAASQLAIKFRLFHGADEAYINYKNYRFSYFLNDPTPAGSWVLDGPDFYEGGNPLGVLVNQENLPPGPTWNQRVIVQFADQLATTTLHLYNQFGNASRVHEGGFSPLRAKWRLHLNTWVNVNWTDDWSSDAAAVAGDGVAYHPITNDWTDPNNPNVPITRMHPDACEIAPYTVDNILVEEWDGYTWRRVFGNGPVAGRQLTNMTITDVLPACMTFGGFIGVPAGVTATVSGQTVTFAKASVNINETGSLQFWVTQGSCGGPVDNTATMAANGEKPVVSTISIPPAAACGGTPTRTPTRTPSPSQTRTPSPSASPTRTGTPSASPTRTASSSPTRSPSPSATPTRTLTISPSPSGSPTRTASSTRTASPSATVSTSPSASLTASPTPSPSRTTSPTATVSASPSVTASASPSRTPTPSYTITFLDTYTVSPTITPSRTASPSPSSSATPSASRTASTSTTPSLTSTLGVDSPTVTPTPTVTITFLDTYTVSPTLTRTVTPSGTPSASPSRTATPTVTITFLDTYTVSPTVTSTATLSATPSASPTASSTRTVSPTPTYTITFLDTYTVSPTLTRTATPTATRTATPTATITFLDTYTVSPTLTRTATPTATRTATPTATITFLDTYTVSPTATSTASATPTSTATRTATLTRTSTRSATPPATVTFTPSVTATPSNSPFATATATPTASPAVTPTATPTRVLQFYEQPELITERGLFPNPFTDRVRIYFNLRTDAVATLTVYNVAGEVIFVRDYALPQAKNIITWDGDNASGGRCASGVYILRIQAVGIDRSNGGYWTTAVIQR